MFIIGLVPVALVIPLRFFMPESPRWLIAKGRFDKAEAVVAKFEASAMKHNQPLPEPKQLAVPVATPKGDVREMFGPFYGPRTVLLWLLWFSAYMVNNGLVTWLPTLYKERFGISIDTAILYGFGMTGVALVASFVCALTIDITGRRRWYTTAFLLASMPMIALYVLGATSATQILVFATLTYAALQTVTYSLYLYSGELYPTRLRSLGAGLGSAWLRLGSIAGPWMIGLVITGGSIAPVFLAFAIIAIVAGIATWKFAPETTGRVLEEVSP